MTEKIDFLIAWVDGNDPVWLKERNYYAALDHREIDNSRYRDWETLRFWFRGVEKYAPWVNKIFFVTYEHLPSWLNTANPKLQIVTHKDFIPAEYLPTFSSNVFEFYFHKIEGLSERFVYFNDDMFLIDNVKPSRFFKNGLPCDIGGMTINIHNGMFGSSLLLSKTLINENFNKQEVVWQSPSKWFNWRYIPASFINVLCLMIRRKEFVGFVNPHLPQGYLKTIYDGVWAHCAKEIVRTSQSKFRDYGDLAPWLIRYWQLTSNSFSPINPFIDGKYYLVDDYNVSDIVSCIRQQKKKVICLNDSENISNFEETKKAIKDAFVNILPEKCSYEK